MAITNSLLQNATSTAFGIFNNLLDEIEISRSADKVWNSSTKTHDGGVITVTKTKGQLFNKRIRSSDGVDYIQQQVIMQYTKELDEVDVKDTLKVNGVTYPIGEIIKDKFIVTVIIQ